MAPKLPWFPFYGRDFYLDEKVKILSLRQEAIYLRLLWYQWEEGSIPDIDICQCFPEFRVTFLEDRTSNTDAHPLLDEEIKRVHMSCFQKHPTLKNRFANPRLEAIRIEQLEKAQKIHDRASKGGHALAQLKHSLSNANASMPKHASSNAIQSQKQRERKKDPDKSAVHSVDTVDKSVDRNGQGLERPRSLTETVLNMMPPELRHEIDDELIVQPEQG